MTELIDAQQAVATYDCKIPDCTAPARVNRGPTAFLCDRHANDKKHQISEQAKQPRPQPDISAFDSYETRAKTLVQAGKVLDNALKRHNTAKNELTAARREWNIAINRLKIAE
jgi:hypothetical protein